MDLPSRTEEILSKVNQFCRLNIQDSNDRIKSALRELLEQWSDLLDAANNATDDELFHLNVSRAVLTRMLALTLVKDCFVNDHSFTRDIARMYSDLLMKQKELFTSPNSIPNGTFLVSNIRLIMEGFGSLMCSLWSSDIDLIDEQLLLAMREYVDQDLTNDELTEGILAFIWSASDRTSLVPMLLRTGYAKSLVEWIKVSPTKCRNNQTTALINILQNMLRYDDAMEQLNHLGIREIIEEIPFDIDLSFSFSMIRVLLTDKNQVELESMEFLNKLVQSTIDAGGNEKYRHEGAHVCELLAALAKLFYNEEILHIILKANPSIIECFALLLVKLYPHRTVDRDPLENFACVLLLNILCCISYHEGYSPRIYENEQLMNVIRTGVVNEKNSIDTFMPRTMKSIEQTASDILQNSNEKL